MIDYQIVKNFNCLAYFNYFLLTKSIKGKSIFWETQNLYSIKKSLFRQGKGFFYLFKILCK
jgi:hypothetical protein